MFINQNGNPELPDFLSANHHHLHYTWPGAGKYEGILPMRCISILMVMAITMAVGQTGGGGSPQEGNPPGSYQQTCSDISVRKGNLYAKCQDEKGKVHSAKLSRYEKCSTDIVNKNGSLQCRSEHAAPSQPPGSYTETCKDIKMKGTTLHAVCKSIDGREMPTSLKEANRCSEGVANINGILNCIVSDVLPPGSYIASCQDVRMRGATLYASCNNGKDRFVPAQLRDAHKCTGDIANHNGSLKCIPVKRMEKR
jgi:hypothetical protein